MKRPNSVILVGVLLAACISPSVHLETSSEKPAAGLLGRGLTAVKSLTDNAKSATGAATRFATTGKTDDEVCYNILGCFTLKSPWSSLLRPLPLPLTPEEVNTQFYLYTRATKERFNVTSFPEINLSGSDYKGTRPTFFIIHGFSSNGNNTWLSDLKDALLERVDGNVFLVDWGNGSESGNYFQVASNTRIVGAELARLGRYLVQNAEADPKQFHMLGHSLGSQIASYAAKNITNVGRITAMDPAQPAFEGLDKEVRIDESDANFVDVIHTNAKPFIPLIGFGMMKPVGHVDFYLNGGADQPGCEVPKAGAIKSLGDLALIPIKVLGNLVSCSHGRSYKYFTEAVKSDCRMWGHKINLAKQIVNWGSGGHLGIVTTNGKCELGECTPMGLDTPGYPSRGTFGIGTAPEPPYCVQENSDDGQDLQELERRGGLRSMGTKKEGAGSLISGLVSFVSR